MEGLISFHHILDYQSQSRYPHLDVPQAHCSFVCVFRFRVLPKFRDLGQSNVPPKQWSTNRVLLWLSRTVHFLCDTIRNDYGSSHRLRCDGSSMVMVVGGGWMVDGTTVAAACYESLLFEA